MLGSLSQDAFGYQRSPVHAGVGQGGEDYGEEAGVSHATES